ncbi:MAG: NADPH-dependent F420 reductase [Actinomycetota bacterium]
MTIAIVGGTGDLGFGLALHLARAGEEVIIGSRSEERGEEAARRANEMIEGGATLGGAENTQAAAAADVVFVTVPYAGQADIYRSIAGHIPEGAVVCDTTTPLATAVGGRPWQVLRPWPGSAAEQAKALLSKGTRLVSAFHSVSADVLEDLDRTPEGDVLLCGDDPEAKVKIGGLVDKIEGLRWVDCGSLSMARILEPLTAVLVSVNRRYGIRDAGVRLVGRDEWGRPAKS